MNLTQLVSILDNALDVRAFRDAAVNGLQVGGPEDVTTVATAVDATLETIDRAEELGAQLLICHHGILWEPLRPMVGLLYNRVKALVNGGVALYAAHLPLDAHPVLGNSHLLAKAVGVEQPAPFGEYRGQVIGAMGDLPEPITPLQAAERLEKATGESVVLDPSGPSLVSSVCAISGGGASMVEQAVGVRADLYVTGERSHSCEHHAREIGLNVLYGGHYATETFGVNALGRMLRDDHGLRVEFIDSPTGL